jgi:hypothetical protein
MYGAVSGLIDGEFASFETQLDAVCYLQMGLSTGMPYTCSDTKPMS